jgi:hypothetical protein
MCPSVLLYCCKRKVNFEVPDLSLVGCGVLFKMVKSDFGREKLLTFSGSDCGRIMVVYKKL